MSRDGGHHVDRAAQFLNLSPHVLCTFFFPAEGRTLIFTLSTFARVMTNSSPLTICSHVFVKRCYPFGRAVAVTTFPPPPVDDGGITQHLRWLWGEKKLVKRMKQHCRAAYADVQLYCDVCGAQRSIPPCAGEIPPSVHNHYVVGGSRTTSSSALPFVSRMTQAMYTRQALLHQLRIHLRKDVSSCTTGSIMTTVATPLAVTRGLVRARKVQNEQLESQLIAGRRFPPLELPSSVLDLSLRMAAFAAASYGPAYIEGFFSSVRSNASLGIPGVRWLVATPEPVHRQAAMELLGRNQSVEVVKCRTFTNMCEASYCLFVDHQHKNIIAAFRGTMSTGDIVTDLISAPVPLSTVVTSTSMSEGKNGKGTVPSGFAMSVHHALRHLEGDLRQLEQTLPDYTTYLTGHSLGAIQANLYHLAAPMSSNGSCRQVVGFAPAPCVSRTIAEAQRCEVDLHLKSAGVPTVINFAFGHDVVPRLQVSTLRDLCQRLPSPGNGLLVAVVQHDKYYLPGLTLWLDPSVSTMQPIRRVLQHIDSDGGSDGDAIRSWNSLPTSLVTVQHHFLQWIQRDLLARRMRQQASQ
jgi:hypothetical protein